MTLKFPKTYKDLERASYIHSVERCESGIFIYNEESYLKDASFDETIAWGESSLKEALKMLKDDFWPTIERNSKTL